MVPGTHALMAMIQNRWMNVVQSLSRVRLCNPMDCSSPGFPVLHHLPEFLQTQAHWVDDAIQPSRPLPSPSAPALNLSQHQVFASGGQSIGASASASALLMNIQGWFPWGWTGLISSAVQGTLKSLLQCHSSKASILQRRDAWMNVKRYLEMFSH